MRNGGVLLVTGSLLSLSLCLFLARDIRGKASPQSANHTGTRADMADPDRNPLRKSRNKPALATDPGQRLSPGEPANRSGILALRKRTWDRTFLSSLAPIGEGSPITFELMAGEMASGKIGYLAITNHEVLYVSGTLTNPEAGRFFFQKQTRPGVAGEFVGIVELPASARAYRIEPTGAGGAPELVERGLEEVVCVGFPRAAAGALNQVAEITAPIPGAIPHLPPPGYQNGISILASLPGATTVIYLDFQGGYTPTWGGIAYDRPAMDNDEISEVWQRVAEDFMPFNINVTTDLRAFQNAVEGSRQRVIITPTTKAATDPLSDGGISWPGSFNYTGDTPCWVFLTDDYGPKACAEACSHEAGHTLGLKHEGGGPHGEYYWGQFNGTNSETGWAPIMGIGYYYNLSQWCHGEYLHANNTEDQLAIIVSRNNNVAFRPDDTGDTLATSRYLELYSDYTAGAQGVIERMADTDAFQFTTFGGSVWLRADPASVGPNLAIAVSLYDANDALVLSNCPQDTLWADLSTDLPAGTYTFRVTGAGRNDPLTDGFSSYASLGYYSITGSVANARLPDRFEVSEHTSPGMVLGTIPVRNDSADPVAYTVVSGNPSNTFALDNSGVLTVADNQLLDYTTLTSQTQLAVQFELFVNITDLLDASLSETNRRVVVAILPVPLVITQQPQSLTVAAGQSAGLSVAASGDLPLDYPVQYQWFFNGTALAGATMATLPMNDVQAQVAGDYTVVVTNFLSALTSVVATLTVTPVPPLFTQQPADQDVLAGSSASLVASSAGTEPIAYQWQLNGVDLADQTNANLLLLDFQPSDAGIYRVLASNSEGVTASAEAYLGVDTVLAWGWNAFGQTNVPPRLSNVAAISAGSEHTLALLREGKVVAWGSGAQTNVPPDLADAVSIAAGGSHSLVLRRDGTVEAWGDDSASQTDLPLTLTNAVAIAAGGAHSLALNADGTVIAWGSNTNGQCDVPAGLSSVVAIGAGANHSLALETDGTVVAWGDDTFGQTDVPADLTNAIAIAAGAQHSLALRADGTVAAWGANHYGQTSLGKNSGQVVAISAGAFHSLALQADGSVVSWGAGRWGSSSFPDSGQALVPAGLSQIAAVAAGSEHSAVLASVGPPFITEPPVSRLATPHSQVIFSAKATGAWPLSFQWQLDGTDLLGATSRVLILDEATNGGDYRVVVSNALGVATSSVARLTLIDRPPSIRVQPASQIGYLGSTVNLQVAAEGSTPFSYHWRINDQDLPQATNATLTLPHLAISQSGAYSVIVSNAFGVVSSATAVVQIVNVVAWGDNSAGQLNVPAGLVGVVQVAAGDYHSLALRADGTVVAWGTASFGAANVPADLTNAVAIAAGGYHSLALRADGTVRGWGSNFGPYQYGQPTVPVYGQASVPAGLTEVVAIAAGEYYSVALRADGQVVVWGGGPHGPMNVPTTVRNIVAVAACPYSIMAIGGAGALRLWGAEIPVPTGSDFVAIAPEVGLLADGEVSTASETENPTEGWIASPGALHGLAAFEVAGSGNQILARASDGTVVVLGGNQSTFAPDLLTNSVAIACGRNHSLVALGNGSLQITAQPSNRKVELGGNTLLRVVAAGAPPLGFQWQLEGADLPGATNLWLRLTNVQFTDAGAYTVVVSNPSQSLTSQVARVSVGPPFLPLGLALDAEDLAWVTPGTSPWFGQTNISHDGMAAAQSGPISEGQRSILQTTVIGPGTLDFWWKVSSEQSFDVLSFAINGQIPATISGQVDWQHNHFEIPPGTNLLTWTYGNSQSSRAGPDAGWLDQVVYRTNPPLISQQPIGQVAPAMTNILLIVSAWGAPPLSYQWLKNGTNLPGATDSLLAITDSTRRDSGIYAVAVSNSGGTTLSSNAQLVVRVAQWLEPVASPPQSGFTLVSRDADGAPLGPEDLASFQAQTSTNLLDWIILPNSLTLTNGSLLLIDPEAANYPQRFYRIIEQQ